jgi:hypothetical protein
VKSGDFEVSSKVIINQQEKIVGFRFNNLFSDKQSQIIEQVKLECSPKNIKTIQKI